MTVEGTAEAMQKGSRVTGNGITLSTYWQVSFRVEQAELDLLRLVVWQLLPDVSNEKFHLHLQVYESANLSPTI
jgi:hypothetical protein